MPYVINVLIFVHSYVASKIEMKEKNERESTGEIKGELSKS